MLEIAEADFEVNMQGCEGDFTEHVPPKSRLLRRKFCFWRLHRNERFARAIAHRQAYLTNAPALYEHNVMTVCVTKVCAVVSSRGHAVLWVE